MIRRTFELPYGDDDDQSLQLLVTYDQMNDTLIAAVRRYDYEAWSRPLKPLGTDDDPVGRHGGPGNRNDPAALIEQMRQLVDAYDDATANRPATAADLAPASGPADDSTAMVNDQARDIPRA